MEEFDRTLARLGPNAHHVTLMSKDGKRGTLVLLTKNQDYALVPQEFAERIIENEMEIK